MNLQLAYGQLVQAEQVSVIVEFNSEKIMVLKQPHLLGNNHIHSETFPVFGNEISTFAIGSNNDYIELFCCAVLPLNLEKKSTQRSPLRYLIFNNVEDATVRLHQDSLHFFQNAVQDANSLNVVYDNGSSILQSPQIIPFSQEGKANMQCVQAAERMKCTSTQFLNPLPTDDSEITYVVKESDEEASLNSELVIASNIFYPSFEEKASSNIISSGNEDNDKLCTNFLVTLTQPFTSENPIPYHVNDTFQLFVEPVTVNNYQEEVSVSNLINVLV